MNIKVYTSCEINRRNERYFHIKDNKQKVLLKILPDTLFKTCLSCFLREYIYKKYFVIRQESLTHRKELSKGRKNLADASLTVEASLVIPIFMFAMFLIMSIFHLMVFRVSLQNALFQECRRISIERYLDSPNSIDVKDQVYELIDSKIKNKAFVLGGADGVDFNSSDLSNAEIIRLSAKYKGKLPYDFFELFDYSFEQKCTMHAFNGYQYGLDGVNHIAREEEYVYVTHYGRVYHRNPECRHIKLNIRQISSEEVRHLRNEYGNRYKACERCNARLQNGTLYITSDGDRYHNELECSGLKRQVETIPLSEAAEKYAPCSSCGGAA